MLSCLHQAASHSSQWTKVEDFWYCSSLNLFHSAWPWFFKTSASLTYHLKIYIRHNLTRNTTLKIFLTHQSKHFLGNTFFPTGLRFWGQKESESPGSTRVKTNQQSTRVLNGSSSRCIWVNPLIWSTQTLFSLCHLQHFEQGIGQSRGGGGGRTMHNFSQAKMMHSIVYSFLYWPHKGGKKQKPTRVCFTSHVKYC